MLCVQTNLDEPAEPLDDPSLGLTSGAIASRSLKAEVNLLRLPLFALHTKGLSTLDGLECRGRLRRDGAVQEYILRISRNTDSLYPGPLSRKVHFALLSIATERGFPLANPITWTWRDLCRRMGIAYGGHKTLKEIKTAIRSTHGIVIHSRYAFFSRSDGQPLPFHERGHHLYSDYAFSNEPRDDGTIADTNAVWFADWYHRKPQCPLLGSHRLRSVEITGGPQPYGEPFVRDSAPESLQRGAGLPRQLPESCQAVACTHANAICPMPAGSLIRPLCSCKRPT